MRYLKKYNESKVTTIDSLSITHPKEMLEWLSVEQVNEYFIKVKYYLMLWYFFNNDGWS